MGFMTSQDPNRAHAHYKLDSGDDSTLLSFSPFSHVHQVQRRRPHHRCWSCWAHVCQWAGAGGSERPDSRPEVSAERLNVRGGEKRSSPFGLCKSSSNPF